MATERLNFSQLSFSQFSALPQNERYIAFAQLLLRNQENMALFKKSDWLQAWTKEDAQIVIGLSNQPSERYVSTPDVSYSLLDDYLHNTTVQNNLRGSMTVTQLHSALMTDNRPKTIGGDMVEELRKVHGNPAIPSRTHLKLRKTATNCGHMFWKNRNYGQRAAMFGLIPSAITSAVLGAITSQSATLTTAGTAMAKFLPGFVTAFGASHAIPPATLAFYALAATLAAAALVLLLSSTLYRNCAKNSCARRPTYVQIN